MDKKIKFAMLSLPLKVAVVLALFVGFYFCLAFLVGIIYGIIGMY